ncbi:unnamed protein product [Thlaspi arvense]|uniref:Uncharacterized protein n=1 Tax=Thlaspi arvense TaxID=13288 RepID=A0AAU9RM66_THLAR|nr:unnamed protein product [Thlaspi arvense]
MQHRCATATCRTKPMELNSNLPPKPKAVDVAEKLSHTNLSLGPAQSINEPKERRRSTTTHPNQSVL